MNDNVVTLDRAIAAIPATGYEVVYVSKYEIFARDRVIGFVVTKERAEPVTWRLGTRKPKPRHGTTFRKRNVRHPPEWDHEESALVHPDGTVETSEGRHHDSIHAYQETLERRKRTLDTIYWVEQRRAAYQKTKARRKTKRHLKLVTDPS